VSEAFHSGEMGADAGEQRRQAQDQKARLRQAEAPVGDGYVPLCPPVPALFSSRGASLAVGRR
jgi:hypothetical protein